MRQTIFLFGEAEKGDFCTPLVCKSFPQLAETFGNPPEESLGILYAVQALMFDRELIFFRVKEEGFSISDYMRGIKLLEKKDAFHNLSGDLHARSGRCRDHRCDKPHLFHLP